MTRLRKELTGRRGWTTAHRDQLATGWCPFPWSGGWADELGILNPAHRRFTTLASVPTDVIQEMRAAWSVLGADIEAECREKSPGRRPWFAWIAELLPIEPLRVVDSEYFDKDQQDHLCAPRGEVWQMRDGCESSLSYLLRRGLLEDGELERIRERESSGPQSVAHRFSVGRQFDWMHRLRPGAHSLACAGYLLGEDFLTPEERKQAAGELALLKSYGGSA